MPIKIEQIKWDGNDEDGRFENVGGYKYDVVDKTSVVKYEPLPKYFLSDDPIEAEELYKEFSKVLNSLSYTYSMSSGLAKSDLFGEALIGLARAYRDWDPSRSDDFKTYAIYRIRDNLNEYTRINARSVVIPSYIRKSNLLISKLKDALSAASIDINEMLAEGKTSTSFKSIDPHLKKKINHLVEKLNNAAERAKVDLMTLVQRAEYIPLDVVIEEQGSFESQRREEQRLHAKLIVDSLQGLMDENEIAICNGIMSDKSHEEIGRELNKSKAWVSQKLKKLRQKIIEKLKEGEIE